MTSNMECGALAPLSAGQPRLAASDEGRVDKPAHAGLRLPIIPERVPNCVAAPCRPPAGSDLPAFLRLESLFGKQGGPSSRHVESGTKAPHSI